MTVTDTTVAPEWLDLDRAIPPSIRDEIREVLAELRAFEPQLAAIGQRAYEVWKRADDAERAAVAALEAAVSDPIGIEDGAHDLFSNLTGSRQLWDEVLRLGGTLHAWTDCQSQDPDWLTQLREAETSTNGESTSK